MSPHIVLAPDSFKESLSAPQVCEALAAGLRAAIPDVRLTYLPIADGGEGTGETLVAARGGTLKPVPVHDALGREITGNLGVLADGETAVVEVAQAAGLALIEPAERDVRRACSAGVGELLRAALDSGARRVIMALGGSATNDGGAGLARALGVRFLDAEGQDLPPGGAALNHLDRVDVSRLDPRLADVEVIIASDVTNPLTGPAGASAVFGPQKGATAEDVALLDSALQRFAQVVQRDVPQLGGRDVADVPGAGAAGGIGAALLALTNAQIKPGIDVVLDCVGFDELLRDADLVITGEGRLDAQTANGKALAGVAQRARAAGVPVFAVAGGIEGEGTGRGPAGTGVPFDAVFPVLRGVTTVEEALGQASENITLTAWNLGRALLVGRCWTEEMQRDSTSNG